MVYLLQAGMGFIVLVMDEGRVKSPVFTRKLVGFPAPP